PPAPRQPSDGLRGEGVAPSTATSVCLGRFFQSRQRMRRGIDFSLGFFVSSDEELPVPSRLGFPPRNRLPSRTRYKIRHLDDGMQGAVLVYRATDEPLRASHYVGLALRESLVEAMGNKVLRSPERCILAIDNNKGQPWTRLFVLLD